jgi:hypothetical protein
MAGVLGAPVNRRTLGWAAAFLLAGLAVALGWFPGADHAAMGPRVGLAAALLTFAVVLGVGSFAALLRMRAQGSTGTGVCPVGAKCACGQFNFKPRTTCRQCGAATLYTA